MREPTQQEAACFIYDMIPTESNARLALERLLAAGLEPVVDAEAKLRKPLALATAKIDKEPWCYKRLASVALNDGAQSSSVEIASDHASDANVSQHAGHDARPDDQIIDLSSVDNDDDDVDDNREINTVSAGISNADPMLAPSLTPVIEVVAHIFIDENIKGVSRRIFMDSRAVFRTLAPYFKPGALKNGPLSRWMGYDRRWGKAKTTYQGGQSKKGRYYNIVRQEYRDFKWTPSVENCRQRIRNMATTHVTIGLAPNAPNSLSAEAKKKALELMAFRLRHKLLCHNVFAFSASGVPGIDGNLQDLGKLLQKEHRKVRLVAMNFADQFDNIVQLKAFLTVNSRLDEIVVDLGKQVHVYKRKDLNNDVKLVKLLRDSHTETI
ncbi:hypothetical protein BC940DRAFT_312484 [Gongronella butleri]|nr:hypothetical protein BC940DRAFT_312484 [Gongronella butleri]